MRQAAWRLALAACLLVIGVGLLALFAPAFLSDWFLGVEGSTRLWLAAGFRLVFGGSLFLAASLSRAPLLLRVLGLLFFTAGLLIPALGQEWFDDLADWFLEVGDGGLRLWGFGTIVFGSLLLFALLPKRKLEGGSADRA